MGRLWDFGGRVGGWGKGREMIFEKFGEEYVGDFTPMV